MGNLPLLKEHTTLGTGRRVVAFIAHTVKSININTNRSKITAAHCISVQLRTHISYVEFAYYHKTDSWCLVVFSLTYTYSRSIIFCYLFFCGTPW